MYGLYPLNRQPGSGVNGTTWSSSTISRALLGWPCFRRGRRRFFLVVPSPGATPASGSVPFSIPLGLIWGRPFRFLSRAISSACAATIASSLAFASKSRITSVRNSSAEQAARSGMRGAVAMPPENPKRATKGIPQFQHSAFSSRPALPSVFEHSRADPHRDRRSGRRRDSATTNMVRLLTQIVARYPSLLPRVTARGPAFRGGARQRTADRSAARTVAARTREGGGGMWRPHLKSCRAGLLAWTRACPSASGGPTGLLWSPGCITGCGGPTVFRWQWPHRAAALACAAAAPDWRGRSGRWPGAWRAT